jgi:hypothetical protein
VQHALIKKKQVLKNKLQWQAIFIYNNQWNVQYAKNEKQKAGDDKQWKLENNTLI